MANFINGGKHAKGSLTFQEFLVVSRHDSIKEAIYKIAETYHKLKNILEEKGLPTLVGDEGGFSPPVKEEEALEILSELIKGQKFSISLDIAASSFYNGTSYKFHGEKTPQEMLNYYRDLCSSFNIFSLEDPFQEEDFEMHQKAREFVKVVGDDLLTTNTERMKINPEAYDMAIIKMNQIGTISETIEAISFLHSHQKEAIVSHRSGETCNTLLVDLAIATGSEFVKIGAPARGERTAKYNRLLELL
jgi:enolase